MKFSAPRGTKDILPEEVKSYRDLEEKARSTFKYFNYKELRTPIFEDEKLFLRSLGQTTEIIQKQLLKLKSNSEDESDFALRPEATASIVRAYLEHNLDKKDGFSKYFYIGPMFRGERPQKGRLREFNHIGAEAIGATNPYLDVEIISLATKLLDDFGVEEYKLKINNLGCAQDKSKLSKLLREEMKNKIKNLCVLCQDRFDRNVFRILDCKNESCKEILKNLKLKEKHICVDCDDHFQKVIKILKASKIPLEISPFLVRGLDYYTGTVFEITHSSLGSQDALGAGGRYDNLISQLGGPNLGAIGFALGVERILLAINKKIEFSDSLDAYIISLDKKAYEKSFLLLNKLRSENISCDIDYEEASLKSQMRSANKAGAKFAIIIGEEELKTDTVSLKEMLSGKQEKIKTDQIIKELKKRL
jgi:histidyl-tRNA synthetase